MTLVSESPDNRFVTRVPEYRCTVCGRDTPRDQLTVKRASFHEMGQNGRRVATRTVGWLCPSCLKDDEDFNREPKHGAFPKPPEPGKQARKK